ncbi:MAG: hypothetical protein HN757_17250, partial [Calditrichaeota bacterium]|nr:hypothetical protein [Calditrichota bacterium]
MRISDIQRGDSSLIEIKSANSDGFGKRIDSLTEASVVSSELNGDLILRIGQDTWDIVGINDHNQALLNRISERNLPRMTWVGTTLPAKNFNPKSMVIEVREFPSEYIWPDAVDFGVDDRIVDAMRSKRKSLDSISRLITWFT